MTDEEKKTEELYLLSDRSLKRLRTVMRILTTVCVVACVVAAFFLFANAGAGGTSYGRDQINSLYVFLGIAFLVIGPAVSLMMYFVFMAYFWTLFDIKAIRSTLAGKALSPILLSFSDNEEEDE